MYICIYIDTYIYIYIYICIYVRFPTITTGLDADEFGNDQVDFTLFLLGRWVPHKKTFLPRTLP